jgi:hypothetical protein
MSLASEARSATVRGSSLRSVVSGIVIVSEGQPAKANQAEKQKKTPNDPGFISPS